MDKPLIKEALLMLHITGFHPYKQNIFSKLRAALTIGLYIVLFTEIILVMVMGGEEVNYFFGIFVSILCLQIHLKLVQSILAKKKYCNLLTLIDQFWGSNQYEMSNEIQSIHKLIKNGTVIFTIVFLLMILGYIIQPIFSSIRKLPIDVYRPKGLTSPGYELEYITQVFNLLYGTTFFIGYDFLFVAIIVHITAELKVIQNGFMNISVTTEIRGDVINDLEEIYCLIDHHNVVMRCIKETNNIYSVIFLNQFLTSMIVICLCLVCVTKDGFPPDLLHLFKYAYPLLPLSGQLFFYCYSGTKLTEECQKVSEAAFESKWWIKSQAGMRRALTLVIQRANKIETLNAVGLVPLNLDSFRIVVKNALSFFTLLQAVYQKSDQKTKRV